MTPYLGPVSMNYHRVAYPLTLPTATTVTDSTAQRGVQWVSTGWGGHLAIPAEPSRTVQPTPQEAKRIQNAAFRRDVEPGARKAHWLR